MNNNTPTPRTDKVVSSDMGDSRFLIDLITHSQQLERELNELKKGEFICRKCGLRKDNEHEKGDF